MKSTKIFSGLRPHNSILCIQIQCQVDLVGAGAGVWGPMMLEISHNLAGGRGWVGGRDSSRDLLTEALALSVDLFEQ